MWAAISGRTAVRLTRMEGQRFLATTSKASQPSVLKSTLLGSSTGIASRTLAPSAGVIAAAYSRLDTQQPASSTTSLLRSSACLQNQKRTMFDWALRPYACAAAANGALGLSTLSAGFSKCSLSLLVCPWKALPTALVVLPMAWAVPAAYRLCFSNCSRGAVAGVFTFFMQFTLTFLPVPAFENLFAELTFYITALCMTFFMYNLFPELMLEDGIWIFYAALFVMPMLPLAFSYLPLFATRTYFIL